VIKKYHLPRPARDIEHAVVYRREDAFCSHPYVRGFGLTAAGHLICDFNVTTVDYAGDPQMLGHFNLIRNPGGWRAVTVRSEDRGRTWTVSNEDKNRSGSDVKVPQPGVDGQSGALTELGPIDYTNKDVLVANFNYHFLNEDSLLKDFAPTVDTLFGPAENQVFFRVSKDAGRTWSRSVIVPSYGFQKLGAIQSSLVRPDGRCLLFLTGVSEEGDPVRPLVYRSTDDGTSFHFLSFITPKDNPLLGGHTQWYPRGLMLPNGRILCTVRVDRNSLSGDSWTELYKSDDGGKTWQYHSRITEFGAPGELLLLSDGRLALVFTYRLPPRGIRAVISEDEGLTWGPEIVVRDDGGSWDLGYQHAWEVEPGKIGAIYYFNSKDDPVQVKSTDTLYKGALFREDGWGAGGVRHIARSIFSVD
jgi:hypothetical protein